MMGFRIAAAFAAIVFAGTSAAHGPARAPRYRVEEVRPPAELSTPCLAGYRNYAQGVINDFGIVGGNFNCYSQFDATTGAGTFIGGPVVWSSWFGALALQDKDPTNCCSFMTSINNRNEIIGTDVGTNLTGVKWSLSGGLETIFPSSPDCDIIQLDIAIASNGRYAVGTSFREDPALPIPRLCLAPAWVTRTPSGEIVTSLLFAEPRDLNAFNVGVGVLRQNTAIRLNVATNEMRVLHTGDDLQRATPTDINDLGEVAGYIGNVDPQPGACLPASADAVRWDRNDVETVLPNLPGAVSSRAWGVGYDGTTVGESGPGQYCDPQNSTNERAVLWRGDKVIDLNTTIPAALGITLAAATSINRRGQITAYGYRNADPLAICPIYRDPPEPGPAIVDLSQRCRRQRIFVLTPQ